MMYFIQTIHIITAGPDRPRKKRRLQIILPVVPQHGGEGCVRCQPCPVVVDRVEQQKHSKQNAGLIKQDRYCIPCKQPGRPDSCRRPCPCKNNQRIKHGFHSLLHRDQRVSLRIFAIILSCQVSGQNSGQHKQSIT